MDDDDDDDDDDMSIFRWKWLDDAPVVDKGIASLERGVFLVSQRRRRWTPMEEFQGRREGTKGLTVEMTTSREGERPWKKQNETREGESLRNCSFFWSFFWRRFVIWNNDNVGNRTIFYDVLLVIKVFVSFFTCRKTQRFLPSLGRFLFFSDSLDTAPLTDSFIHSERPKWRARHC